MALRTHIEEMIVKIFAESLAVHTLLGNFVSCDEHFVGAVEVVACAAKHGEQGVDNGRVGISRRAVYAVALG